MPDPMFTPHDTDEAETLIIVDHWGGVAKLAEAPLPQSFRCPRCGTVSYRPSDIADRYCGACYE